MSENYSAIYDSLEIRPAITTSSLAALAEMSVLDMMYEIHSYSFIEIKRDGKTHVIYIIRNKNN